MRLSSTRSAMTGDACVAKRSKKSKYDKRDEVKASANPSKAKPNNKCERLLSYFPRNARISLRCFFASLRPVW